MDEFGAGIRKMTSFNMTSSISTYKGTVKVSLNVVVDFKEITLSDLPDHGGKSGGKSSQDNTPWESQPHH